MIPPGFVEQKKGQILKGTGEQNNIGEQETYENKLELGGNKGTKSVLLTLILSNIAVVKEE